MNKIEINAQGLRCPLPLLKLKQGLAAADSGDEITILATDAGAVRDIPAFVDLTNHSLLNQSESNDVYTFIVLKGA